MRTEGVEPRVARRGERKVQPKGGVDALWDVRECCFLGEGRASGILRRNHG